MDGNREASPIDEAAEVDEIPVAALLDDLQLPRAVLGRWWDHLDRYFASHGGARRYGALAALIAEARAAGERR
jgi:hypothetical protein